MLIQVFCVYDELLKQNKTGKFTSGELEELKQGNITDIGVLDKICSALDKQPHEVIKYERP